MSTAKEFAVAICDDTLQDADFLENCIRNILAESKIVKYTKGENLLRDLEEQVHQYDLVFLAICMKEKNGIDTAKEIRKIDTMLPIAFVSRSEKFYREAFDVFAFQYLLKPVTCSEVKSVLNRLGMVREPAIVFRYRSRIFTIRHHEIVYISSSLHTVNFHMTNGKEFHCRGKLADFEEQLKNSHIIRCHQSFFVNMENIIGMKSNSIITEESIIPVSRTYMKEVQKRYRQYLNDK